MAAVLDDVEVHVRAGVATPVSQHDDGGAELLRRGQPAAIVLRPVRHGRAGALGGDDAVGGAVRSVATI